MSRPVQEAVTSVPLAGLLQSHDVVDLTVLVAEDLPCAWSTHMPFQHKTFNWFADQGGPGFRLTCATGAYHTRWLLMDEHTGTHLDAPSHFVPPPGTDLPDAGTAGDTGVDKVPLEQMLGPAAVIDVPSGTAAGGESPVFGPEVVHDWEDDNGRLEAGTVVLFRTGWDQHYQPGPQGRRYVADVLLTARTPGWPAPGPEVMRALHDRGVRCAGTDGASMGPAHDGRPTHLAALSRGMVFVECLTGLDALPTTGAFFCFLPLKVRDGSGAPGRAIAFVPRESSP